MAWLVSLGHQAEADFRALTEYLERYSPKAARRLGHELADLMGSLDQLPHRGAILPGYPALRRLAHREILVIYQIDEAARRVRIIRLWDGRQDPSAFRA